MNQASPRPVRIRSVTPPATHPVAPSHTGTPKMSTNPSLHLPTAQANTAGWVTFTYASFATAAFMTGLGIWALPADLWVKGYMAMAALFLCGATFTLAKTVRDEHEAKRFANRIEEAKTEKLLMEMHRG